MRRRGLAALAAALLFPLAAASCRRQPEKPLELTLTLVKTRLKPHDALWYVLEMKNIGIEDVFVSDKFWHDQRMLVETQESRLGTFFELQGPDGAPMEADFGWIGFHGEYDFWSNPPYNPPKYYEGGAWLAAGRTMTASPSIPAPLRGRNLEDMRRGPPGKQREWTKFLHARTPAYAEWPEWARPRTEKPAWVPPSARILTGFDFPKPGNYRIRAVYEPVRKEWLEKGEKILGGLPEGTRIFRYESPWVRFEVVH